MVRVAEGEADLLKYLSLKSTECKFALGLILGLISAKKYYITHFVRTPLTRTEVDKRGKEVTSYINSIEQVNEKWVGYHARQITRMLPARLNVLGIFIVSDKDVLGPLHAKVKASLLNIHQLFAGQPYLFANVDNEKLVFQYSPATKSYSGKIYDVVLTDIKPVEYRFTQDEIKMVNFKCAYKIDQVCYLKGRQTSEPLKDHLLSILDKIYQKLELTMILFNDKARYSHEVIDSTTKKKRSPRGQPDEPSETDKPILVTMLELPNPFDEEEAGESVNISGHIRVVGNVLCDIWMISKATFGEAMRAVLEDIMRSLVSRLEMHWNSLIEEELSEDVNTLHEPPRRILISLPDSSIKISDYLFPGEGPEDVKPSLEELFDIFEHNNMSLEDLEGQANMSLEYKKGSPPPTTETEPAVPEVASGRNPCYIALAGAIGALLLAMVITFVMRE